MLLRCNYIKLKTLLGMMILMVKTGAKSMASITNGQTNGNN